MNLDDLIKYEKETTYLDFKKNQYEKGNYHSLIKDIISMANADIEEDRYIIIGVKCLSDGNKEIIGINREEFVDEATYQQIIKDNIEPELTIDYFPHKYKRKTLGVFKISLCNEKPYLMKKDFGKLKKGDGFIRKGSFQTKLLRVDYERIYKNKLSYSGFSGTVEFRFSENNKRSINLEALNNFEFPSDRAAKKIKNSIIFKLQSEQGGIEKKQLENIENPKVDSIALNEILKDMAQLPKYKRLYDWKSIERLQRELENVKKEYLDHDLYKLYEKYSHRINIKIINKGMEYIEDASIEVKIMKLDGLGVADKVFEKPKPILNPRFGIPEISNFSFNQYPRVRFTQDYILIENDIGDLRHQRETGAFVEDIRIVFNKILIGKMINLNCRLFGKNLANPIEDILSIRVIESKD